MLAATMLAAALNGRCGEAGRSLQKKGFSSLFNGSLPVVHARYGTSGAQSVFAVSFREIGHGANQF
jgi:hypothetical protein